MSKSTFAAVLAVVVVCVACSRTGNVSGDVFVTMKSGDVKRGADVHIALVAATATFDATWKKAVEEYKRDYAEADTRYAQARGERDAAFQRQLEDIRRGFYQSSFPRDFSDNAMAAARAVDDVVRRYRTAAREMISAAEPKTTRTDVNGRYSFKDIPAGRYYLAAEHRVFDNELRWMVPIEVKSGDNRMDLTNSNAGWPF